MPRVLEHLAQRLVWRIFGAYKVDPAMLDALDQSIQEQAERMGLHQ